MQLDKPHAHRYVLIEDGAAAGWQLASSRYNEISREFSFVTMVPFKLCR